MNNWKNNKSFMQMDPSKQHMVELLVNSLHGKDLNEALPILANWKDKLRTEHISLCTVFAVFFTFDGGMCFCEISVVFKQFAGVQEI